MTGYHVERCQGSGCTNFAQIATAAGASSHDTTVTAGTSYTYRVRALEATGNLGPYSDTTTAATGLTVSPRRYAITPGLTERNTATVPRALDSGDVDLPSVA